MTALTKSNQKMLNHQKMLSIGILIFPFLFTSFTSNAQTQCLGINLDQMGAFVNIMNLTNRYDKVLSFDSHGWPQSDFELVLMDNRPVAEWSAQIDDPEIYRVDYSGVYHAKFTGQSNISIFGSSAVIQNKIYDAPSNTTYFEIMMPGPPSPDYSFMYLTFSNTKMEATSQVNTGIANLVVNRPGYDLSTNKVFTDEYINLCKSVNFDCYRYYNVENIWDAEPVFPATTKWADRKLPDDACQSSMVNSTGKKDGWCWEYIIQLANILKKDIWINIPISCDSNYVAQLANLLKSDLDPNINIYVENSNECWSPSQVTHGQYNQAQANQYGITFDQNYARRVVELSNYFSKVFGIDQINKRIRVICAGQQAYLGRTDNHLNYINATFGPPKNYIYATSSSVYFNTTLPDSTPSVICDGMIEDINNQIDNPGNSSNRKAHIKKAQDWELPGGVTSYEGGPATPGDGSSANLSNKILAHRDAKMKDVVIRNYKEAWFEIGGGLAMYFTLASGYNRYGCWGMTDDYTNPGRNYKLAALNSFSPCFTTSVDEATVEGTHLEVYPNPSNNATTIKYLLKTEQRVTLSLYNQLSENLLVLKDENMPAGEYVQEVDNRGLRAGVYYCVLKSEKDKKVVKLVVVR